MNGPAAEGKPFSVTNDEMRLVRFFRCLDTRARRDLLIQAGREAMSLCLPDRSVIEFMPIAGGIQPERIEDGLFDLIAPENTIVGILYQGIEATGEPDETLLGPGDDPEAGKEAVQRFASAAEAQALKQGSFFNYDEAFARTYLRAWRWGILRACEAAAAGGH